VFTSNAPGLTIALFDEFITGNCIVRGWPKATTVQLTIMVPSANVCT
jgi:hypothetical protein